MQDIDSPDFCYKDGKSARPMSPHHRVTEHDSIGDARESPVYSGHGDLNILIHRSLARYLMDRHPPEVLDRAAAAAGLKGSDFVTGRRWISLEQAEAFLTEARRAFPDDRTFSEACAYRYTEGWGPLLFLVRAMSPWNAFVASGKHFMPTITRIGRFEFARSGTRCTARHFSAGGDNRLLCLTRLGQIAAFPTAWGLPRMHVEHPSCAARGDAYCEYVFRLGEPARWFPAAFCSALGLLALGLLRVGGLAGSWWSLLLPIASSLVGAGYEWRRASRSNLALALDTRNVLAELALNEAEAQQEILAFHARERQWVRRLEEQVAERVEGYQRVIEEMRTLDTHRVKVLRALSHDLRNPLSVLNTSAFMLCRGGTPDGNTPALDEIVAASEEMGQLLSSLMSKLSEDAGFLKLAPRELSVVTLVQKLGRRLDALCQNRGIRTNAACAEDVPTSIVADELLFDRVTDNLLSNAAKYTEQGSISIKVGASSGFLTVEVSDTGRGIAPEELERIFRPEGSDSQARTAGSYGLGLSVVVQLLDEIGGKLEVMSKPGVGSTFRAHFPVEPSKTSASGDPGIERDSIRRVVIIR